MVGPVMGDHWTGGRSDRWFDRTGRPNSKSRTCENRETMIGSPAAYRPARRPIAPWPNIGSQFNAALIGAGLGLRIYLRTADRQTTLNARRSGLPKYANLLKPSRPMSCGWTSDGRSPPKSQIENRRCDQWPDPRSPGGHWPQPNVCIVFDSIIQLERRRPQVELRAAMPRVQKPPLHRSRVPERTQGKALRPLLAC